ncbi:MAG: class I SAM-dependent methyltransferase [Chthoniobacterales bacterium]
MISSPSRPAAEGLLARRTRFRRIAANFDCSIFTRGYIVGKLATDPAYAAVLRTFGGSELPLVDIGCGLGLLAHYLRGHGFRASIRGYDFDTRKIHMARGAAAKAGLNDVQFEIGDAADHAPRTANIVLLDVLHYLDADTRKQLLTELAGHAQTGGAVLIRGAVRERSWRYRVTVAQEFWTRWSGWIPSPSPIAFPTLEEIVAPFHAAGCRCEVQPLWGRTPFNSRLIIAATGS